jgi:GNAT superfamily N-acetyltransferase
MNQLNTIEYYDRRLREECERKSYFEVGALVLARALRKSFTTTSSIWYHLPLRGSLPSIQPKILAEFNIMPFSEAKDYFQRNNALFPWMYIDQELEVAAVNGHVFPSFSIDGRVVAYLKVGVKEVYVLDFHRVLHLPPATAIIYDTFVVPELRCRGLGESILSRTAHYLEDAGYQALWAQIPEWNVASTKMNIKAGFQPVGKVRYIRSFGKEVFRKHPKTFPLHFKVNGKENELVLNAPVDVGNQLYWKHCYEQEKQMEVHCPPKRI